MILVLVAFAGTIYAWWAITAHPTSAAPTEADTSSAARATTCGVPHE